MDTVDDILSLARSYQERGEMNAAKIVYDRASTWSKGKLAYARFLLTVGKLECMSATDRAQKAEQLLLYVEQNGKADEAREACEWLAKLYRKKETRSLGYSMRACRYRGGTDGRYQEALLKKITRLSIPDVESDPYGCYIVGQECSRFSDNPAMLKWALYFLGVAAEKGNATYCGPAAQLVADLCEGRDREMYSRYQKLAAAHGYPEILIRH